MDEKPCAFCQIVGGEREAHVVLDREHALGFLDRRPLFPGHCLLIPCQHVETLDLLPAGQVEPLFSTLQLLQRAVERTMDAEGSFIAVNNRVSQSVPHLHVHVVPRRRKDGLRGFFWPRNPYPSDDEAAATAAAIRRTLGGLMSKGRS